MKKSVIMVVEDEMIVAEDLRLRLTAMGYAVPERLAAVKKLYHASK
jgi:hypothetical protein